MTFNYRLRVIVRYFFAGPSRVIAAVVLALGLMLLPGNIVLQLRSTWQSALQPSLQLTSTIKQQVTSFNQRWQSTEKMADELAAARERVSKVESQNRRLANQLQTLRQQLVSTEDGPGQSPHHSPLVIPRFVDARVLGQQGRALLNHLVVVDAGRAEQILPQSFVLEENAAVLDQGADAHLKDGQLVLDGYRVFGKIAEVGPQVSRMLPVDAAEYRDAVRIVDHEDPQREHGRGMLEGTGQRRCRIRLVDITQPVAVGDLVYSSAGEEQLPTQLLYGHVEQVAREPGAPHWEIRVCPTHADHTPTRVTVLTSDINPTRLANRPLE